MFKLSSDAFSPSVIFYADRSKAMLARRRKTKGSLTLDMGKCLLFSVKRKFANRPVLHS